MLLYLAIIRWLSPRLAGAGHTLLPYAYPAAAVVMLVTLFLGIDLGALVAVAATAIVSLASDGSMLVGHLRWWAAW